MIEFPIWLLWLLLIPVFYLGFPLVIWLSQRYPARPKLLELDMDDLDEDLEKFLRKRTRALFSLGFDEPTYIEISKGAPNVSTYLVLLVNRDTGDKATVTAMVGHGVTQKIVLYVEFSTRFDTGQVFNTHNIPELLAFPPAPMSVRTQVPMVKDVRELFELHTFVMNKHDPPGTKVLYEPGKALSYVRRFVFVKSYDDQVERGWLYYDEDKEVYGPTFVGAYLICWGLMQPFKAFRKMAMHQRAKRILAEFDEIHGNP